MIEVIFPLVYTVISDVRVDVTIQTVKTIYVQVDTHVINRALNALVKFNSKLGSGIHIVSSYSVLLLVTKSPCFYLNVYYSSFILNYSQIILE